MSLFQEASAAELIRASQKDEFFMQTIRSQLLDIVSEIFGAYSARYEHEIDLIAKLLYFVPTTLFSHSTLGEEYCSIKPVSHGSPFNIGTPSVLRRVLLMTVAVTVPYIYNKIRKTGRTQHIHESWSSPKKNMYKIWNMVLSVLLKCDKFISFVLKFHLCYFYFYGKFYELSKYLVGITYIYTGSPQNNSSRIISYTGLGRLLIIQFIISFIIVLVQFAKYLYFKLSNKSKRQQMMQQLSPKRLLRRTNLHLLFDQHYDESEHKEEEGEDEKKESVEEEKKEENKSESQTEHEELDSNEKETDEEELRASDSNGNEESRVLSELGLRYEHENEGLNEEASNTPECVLCLSSRRYPTVTECGHIFCWNCIAEWCTTKPQCPLCKSHITHQKLIRLANFR